MSSPGTAEEDAEAPFVSFVLLVLLLLLLLPLLPSSPPFRCVYWCVFPDGLIVVF